MHRAADLLVEQDDADGTVDAEVGPDAEFTEPPCAVIGGQCLLQVVVTDVRPGGDDFAVAELELDVSYLDPGGRGRHVEADASVRARLVGAVKTSPDGMLRLPSEFTHVGP